MKHIWSSLILSLLSTHANAEGLPTVKCSEYLALMQKENADENSKNHSSAFLLLNGVALGAYLSVADRKAAEVAEGEDVALYKRYYEYCQKNPEKSAIDGAVIAANAKDGSSKSSDADEDAPTVTAEEIAKGTSQKKTELEQEAWWEENMAGKTLQFVGKVKDVQKGSFSGYWVNIDIGKNIRVRCGMSSDWQEKVTKIKKGQSFTCKGEVSRTWTSIFGTTFQVDAG
ncbi:hypothetical protein [Brucella anthropi]|uniref:hypothetical protein n=1 Tax=Brucella anthropi TaxID=529 RepID=UPI00124BECB7|nr:hypothetical protein [Brucella anthropi]KAB2779416.1 hypothetical protein F9K99_13940 [Brucella anthropi]